MRVDKIRARSSAGFTLLEIMTVVVIMALLATMAIAVYSNQRRALRSRLSAKQIETLFSTARTLSINQNAHFQAVLDLATSGLWIDQVDADGSPVSYKITTPETMSSYVQVVDVSVNGTAYTGGVVRIHFRPNGTSESARIVLLNEGGDSRGPGEYYTIKLYGPTARSRIYPGERL